MSLRLWAIDKLKARPSEMVREETSRWQEGLEKERAQVDGLKVVISSLESQLRLAESGRKRAEISLEEERGKVAQRVRELQQIHQEKRILTDELAKRNALISNSDERITVEAKRKILESLPVAVQQAACYACEKISKDRELPKGAFGKNFRRDEACEWATHWLRENREPYRDSDVHLACEVYYHLNYRGK